MIATYWRFEGHWPLINGILVFKGPLVSRNTPPIKTPAARTRENKVMRKITQMQTKMHTNSGEANAIRRAVLSYY